MATAAQIRAFRSQNNDLVTLAQNDLRGFWSALNVDGNPILVRDALLEFFPELVQAYGDGAALLAADFYDELRDVPASASRFAAVLQNAPDAGPTQAAAVWALGPLFSSEPNALQALANLAGVTQRLVLQSGRDTVINAAGRDPVRTGFARIPVGPTCRFCTMVAARGFVYRSAATAGDNNKWHNDCNCIVISGRSKRDLPEGYDLADLEQRYADGVGIGS